MGPTGSAGRSVICNIPKTCQRAVSHWRRRLSKDRRVLEAWSLGRVRVEVERVCAQCDWINQSPFRAPGRPSCYACKAELERRVRVDCIIKIEIVRRQKLAVFTTPISTGIFASPLKLQERHSESRRKYMSPHGRSARTPQLDFAHSRGVAGEAGHALVHRPRYLYCLGVGERNG